MSRYILTTVLLFLFSSLSLAFAEPVRGGSTVETREMWEGRFAQVGNVRWEGSMQLYLRYNPSEDYPQKIRGTINWKDLGGAITLISGQKYLDRIEFQELSCLNAMCAEITLGGGYAGVFNSTYNELRGDASLPGMGLSGHFLLKRIMQSE